MCRSFSTLIPNSVQSTGTLRDEMGRVACGRSGPSRRRRVRPLAVRGKVHVKTLCCQLKGLTRSLLLQTDSSDHSPTVRIKIPCRGRHCAPRQGFVWGTTLVTLGWVTGRRTDFFRDTHLICCATHGRSRLTFRQGYSSETLGSTGGSSGPRPGLTPHSPSGGT